MSKTAMEELSINLRNTVDGLGEDLSDYERGYKAALLSVVFNIDTEMLTIERRNLIDTYSHGWHDGQDVIIKQVSHINIGGDEAGKEHFNRYFSKK